MGLYLMMAAVVCFVWGVPIWLTIKAKPIGDRPYRWGTFIGVMTGMCTLPIMLLGWRVFASDKAGNITAFTITVGCGLLACSGILRRQKFGPVFFPFFYLLLMALGNKPSPTQGASALATLIMVGLTCVYFSKRWRFMNAK